MRRFTILVAVLLLGALTALPAVGGGAKVDTIRDFSSVVAVADADNELGVLLMNMHCDFLKRVELADGSAKETMSCQITDSDGLDPFGGTIPTTTYKNSGGECVWFSDYWSNHPTEPQEIYGSSYSQQVSPSGKVHATIRYQAEPLTAEDCFGPPPEE